MGKNGGGFEEEMECMISIGKEEVQTSSVLRRVFGMRRGRHEEGGGIGVLQSFVEVSIGQSSIDIGEYENRRSITRSKGGIELIYFLNDLVHEIDGVDAEDGLQDVT